MEKEKVWKEHSEVLRSFVLTKIKDHDLCSDILQDVYIKLHQNFDKIKDQAKVRPWLFTIARNMIHDHFRNKKHTVISDIITSTEENSVNKKFEKCLVPHINKLPLIYKEAFTKVELGNYSQLELADELKISYSGAKSRVQRAKQLLKKYFNDCCNITSDKYGNIVSYSVPHSCKAC
jgi:RNA polymerase sigma-70 factor (ECF subfamily)